jgi:hypothetical protein
LTKAAEYSPQKGASSWDGILPGWLLPSEICFPLHETISCSTIIAPIQFDVVIANSTVSIQMKKLCLAPAFNPLKPACDDHGQDLHGRSLCPYPYSIREM